MGDEEQRRKAVSAVLDKGKSQVSVRKQHGITAYRLGVWLADERIRRSGPTSVNSRGPSESRDMRLRRLLGEWEKHEVHASQIVEGLRKPTPFNMSASYVHVKTLRPILLAQPPQVRTAELAFPAVRFTRSIFAGAPLDLFCAAEHRCPERTTAPRQ